MQEREALARRRPTVTMGRLRTARCAKAISKDHRSQTDSGVHPDAGGTVAAQTRTCQEEKGVVKWISAGVATFNGTPGIPILDYAEHFAPSER